MLKKFKTNYNAASDEELMHLVQHGECKAFDEIYVRYNERLYYYFYRMLGHEHLIAEDFVHDLFLKLINKPYLFDPQRSFTTWVFSIAHNMCKNEYRNRQVHSIINHEDNPDEYLTEPAEPQSNEKILAAVFNELDKMDESHKTAFLLKYREGFTLEEISEIMDLPIGTVKSRLFYARKRLQNNLTLTIND
jgi:RNA polymerase sigma-70 factor, ECF subfamily